MADNRPAPRDQWTAPSTQANPYEGPSRAGRGRQFRKSDRSRRRKGPKFWPASHNAGSAREEGPAESVEGPDSVPVPPPRVFLGTDQDPARVYFGGFTYKISGAFAQCLMFNCASRDAGCKASLRLGADAEVNRNAVPHGHERPPEPTGAGVSLQEGFNCVKEERKRSNRAKQKLRKKAKRQLSAVAAQPAVHGKTSWKDCRRLESVFGFSTRLCFRSVSWGNCRHRIHNTSSYGVFTDC